MSRVAIIMPYYNEKDLLVKSVRGVLGQTYTDWHLYLIDDGSALENQAIKVLNDEKFDLSKITVIHKDNGGVCSARNLALNYIRDLKVNYDYVAYCDSDDIWITSHLEQQIKILNETNNDFVYSAVRYQLPDGAPAWAWGIAMYDEWPGLNTLWKGNFIYISSVVCKIKCLDMGNFDYDLNSIEDWDMWCRIGAAGYNITKNKNITITYTCKLNGNGSKGNSDIYRRFYAKHSHFLEHPEDKDSRFL